MANISLKKSKFFKALYKGAQITNSFALNNPDDIEYKALQRVKVDNIPKDVTVYLCVLRSNKNEIIKTIPKKGYKIHTAIVLIPKDIDTRDIQMRFKCEDDDTDTSVITLSKC